MFKKLLSNLPFNPSLIGQVSFYAARLHRESVARRTGLIILSLAIVLQVFAVVSPPQSSLARSNNDLITGGITSKAEAVSYCEKNVRDFKTILDYYGISCATLEKTTTVELKSTDYDKRLYSMGHLAYGKPGETPVEIPGAGTVYLRHLWVWDSGQYSTYKALKGTTADGKTFFLLYNCGNLTFIGIPTPPKVCEYDKALLASSKKCFEPCPVKGKESIAKSSDQCFEPCPYNKKIPSNNKQCFEPCPVKGKESIAKKSPECFIPCKYNSTISENNPACKPCTASQTKEDLTACIEYRKLVSNTTQNIKDANNTTAKAGDVITYTLSTINKGKATIQAFSVTENISDVLDYATVENLGGATINQDNVLIWPATSIGSNKTITKTFTVRIKSPIPATPVSSSDAGHYDLAMTNVYGNTVTVKLPPPIAKTTEVVAQTLPNTGPGTSLIIGFSMTTFVAYLFARSRLMAKELDIVRNEIASTGGN